MSVARLYPKVVLLLTFIFSFACQDVMSQERVEARPDSPQPLDSLKVMLPQDSTIAVEGATFGKDAVVSRDTAIVVYADSLQRTVGDTLDLNRFNNWKPDPIRAMWLAMVVPGGGQIYNRKFWKLPIVYGGFVGCMYAYNWNGQMYKDYRQAYLDIMDSDPNTDSYKEFFRPGYDFEANKEYLKDVFKKRKDRYRRWRDLSIFSFIAVYALSVVDAYVDAQLSNFDISEDINMSIEPQIIDSRQMFCKDYYGFNCNIRF